MVTVFIPEYVLGHWWEQLLHNQSALRLKARLLLQPGVIVASVPYQLRSARTDALAQAAAHGQHPAAHHGGRLTHVEVRSSGGVAFAGKAAVADDMHEGGLAKLRHHIAAAHEEILAEELQARFADVQATPIADLADREQAEVVGTLRAVTVRPRGNSAALQAELWDGSGSITLVWLGRRSIPGIEPGRHLRVRGRVASHRGARTIFNPGYELRPPGGEHGGVGGGETVAHPWLGAQVARPRRIGLQLAAQVGHVHPQVVAFRAVLGSPDLLRAAVSG